MTKKDELTWEELKPLLMWLTLPCCNKNKGVRKDTRWPRSLKCKHCGTVWMVSKDGEAYRFQRAL
jgi:hypothetical protein